MKGYFTTGSNLEDKDNAFLRYRGDLSVDITTDKLFWVKSTRIVVTLFDKKITKKLPYPKGFEGITDAYCKGHFDETLAAMAQELGAKPDRDLSY